MSDTPDNPTTVFDKETAPSKKLHLAAMRYVDVIKYLKESKHAEIPDRVCPLVTVMDFDPAKTVNGEETSRPITKEEYWQIKEYYESGEMNAFVQQGIYTDRAEGGHELKEE